MAISDPVGDLWLAARHHADGEVRFAAGLQLLSLLDANSPEHENLLKQLAHDIRLPQAICLNAARRLVKRLAETMRYTDLTALGADDPLSEITQSIQDIFRAHAIENWAFLQAAGFSVQIPDFPFDDFAIRLFPVLYFHPHPAIRSKAERHLLDLVRSDGIPSSEEACGLLLLMAKDMRRTEEFRKDVALKLVNSYVLLGCPAELESVIALNENVHDIARSAARDSRLIELANLRLLERLDLLYGEGEIDDTERAVCLLQYLSDASSPGRVRTEARRRLAQVDLDVLREAREMHKNVSVSLEEPSPSPSERQDLLRTYARSGRRPDRIADLFLAMDDTSASPALVGRALVRAVAEACRISERLGLDLPEVRHGALLRPLAGPRRSAARQRS